ncbi:MAG TPA: hypothetical protein VFD51_01095 [Patescibacteria group bacterium]|nr:hypothetical protein [Patescibacteria group bacterium]
MRITKKSIISFLFLMTLVLPGLAGTFLINPALADETLVEGQTGLSEVGSIFGGNRAEQDPRGLAANIISIALGFLAVIFLGITIAAGFQYMTAGGNQEKTSKALALLKNAVIGLVIVLAAWALTRFTIVMLNRAALNMDTNFYPAATM